MIIFHSYVQLPEGSFDCIYNQQLCIQLLPQLVSLQSHHLKYVDWVQVGSSEHLGRASKSGLIQVKRAKVGALNMPQLLTQALYTIDLGSSKSTSSNFQF